MGNCPRIVIALTAITSAAKPSHFVARLSSALSRYSRLDERGLKPATTGKTVMRDFIYKRPAVQES